MESQNLTHNQLPATFAKHLFLIFCSIVFAFPFLWMVMGAFKSNNEIWQKPYQLLPEHWQFENVLTSLMTIDFSQYIFNSFFVAVIGSIFMLILATLFTYAVVFLGNSMTNRLFYFVLITYMLPSAVTYVPAYVILARMGLLDSLTGLIISNSANVFAVFYLRQSFLKTDRAYIEAAKIDGASHMQIIKHVVFPMNKSAFYTLFVLTFIQQYNSYMWPSIMNKSQDKFLVSQGLRQFFIQDGAYGMNWSEVMLASTVTLIPIIIVFIIGQKWFLTGIVSDSGIK